jgi:beta-lactamase superfamily II metal-dependent hydrolase
MGAVIEGPPGTRLYVLWPLEQCAGPDTARAPRSLNNCSIVIRLVYGGISFLFTGDAPVEVEEMMVARFGGFLRSTVLKVGHHGSASSSSQQLLDVVRPSMAALSVGLHNTFGHPAPAVLQAFDDLRIEVVRTDHEGAIILATDGHSLWRVPWR